jgi:hypothetical protein
MATASVDTPIYVYRIEWVVILLVASMALVVAGAVLLLLQLHCTLAPGILRYVVSMMYANSHFSTLTGGTAPDGMQRTQLLRRVRVRIGDINSDNNNVGGVAHRQQDDMADVPQDYRLASIYADAGARAGSGRRRLVAGRRCWR